jgi:hypothetical protein
VAFVVPGAGVEPARPEGQGILSPPRMPFRHPGTVHVSLSHGITCCKIGVDAVTSGIAGCLKETQKFLDGHSGMAD